MIFSVLFIPCCILFFSGFSSNNSRGNCYWKPMETQTMKTSIGTNNWSMVDHMMSAVSGNMLLDSDVGNMVNLVVHLNTNLVNNGGSSNSNRCSMDNWGSMSNSKWSSMSGSNWGSMSKSKRSSMCNSNRGSFNSSRSRSINTFYEAMSQ